MTFFKTPLTPAMPSHDLCPPSRHPAFMKPRVGLGTSSCHTRPQGRIRTGWHCPAQEGQSPLGSTGSGSTPGFVPKPGGQRQTQTQRQNSSALSRPCGYQPGQRPTRGASPDSTS